MSICLAAEVRQFGIEVSVISPGGYDTAVGGNLWQPDAVTDEPSYRATAEQVIAGWWRHVRGRDPREVARAIGAAIAAESPPIRQFVGDDSLLVADRHRHMTDDQWADEMTPGRGGERFSI